MPCQSADPSTTQRSRREQEFDGLRTHQIDVLMAYADVGLTGHSSEWDSNDSFQLLELLEREHPASHPRSPSLVGRLTYSRQNRPATGVREVFKLLQYGHRLLVAKICDLR